MKDQLNHMLFEHSGRKLKNIKFMPGHGQVSVTEFRKAAADIVFDIEAGIADVRDSFGDTKCKTVNVAKLVETL